MLPGCLTNPGAFPKWGRALSVSLLLPVAVAQNEANHVLQLDGDGDYVELPAGAFAELEAVTVEGWVKWEEFLPHSRFFDFQGGDLRMHVALLGEMPALRLERAGETDRHFVDTNEVLEVGKWAHVAATRAGDELQLIVNGVPFSKVRFLEGNAKREGRNVLGRANDQANPHFLHGQVDELRVWDHVRSAEEIEATMGKELTGEEEELVAAWDFKVAKLVREVESTVQPLIGKNANTLELECNGDLGTMHADLTKTRQVLFNLLSNAAKFTEKGTITLRVFSNQCSVFSGEKAGAARGSLNTEGCSLISFEVRDSGIGMNEDQLGKLFEAFSQADASTSRKYGGTGLGLAISRKFCRLMGGDLTVTSAAGEGSTFTVTLPTVVESPTDSQPQSKELQSS